MDSSDHHHNHHDYPHPPGYLRHQQVDDYFYYPPAAAGASGAYNLYGDAYRRAFLEAGGGQGGYMCHQHRNDSNSSSFSTSNCQEEPRIWHHPSDQFQRDEDDKAIAKLVMNLTTPTTQTGYL